jgi:N-acetylmuramoyl-L-alanine amidase
LHPGSIPGEASTFSLPGAVMINPISLAGFRLTIAWRFGTVALALLIAFGASDAAWAEAGQAGRPASSSCDRGQFRVVVDVGHTAEAGGAISARGMPEYAFNLQLANRIGQSLTRAGFGKTIVLVTAGSTTSGLDSRVARANALPADLFLSVHHDSVPEAFLESWEYAGVQRPFSDRFKGHSLFISAENADPAGSLLFAQFLGGKLKSRGLRYTPHYTEAFMGFRQRELVDAEAGVYRYDQLRVLRETRMPAVLLEAGSIIHRGEEVQVASPKRQALVAAAVTQAVELFCAARSPKVAQRQVR